MREAAATEAKLAARELAAMKDVIAATEAKLAARELAAAEAKLVTQELGTARELAAAREELAVLRLVQLGRQPAPAPRGTAAGASAGFLPPTGPAEIDATEKLLQQLGLGHRNLAPAQNAVAADAETSLAEIKKAVELIPAQQGATRPASASSAASSVAETASSATLALVLDAGTLPDTQSATTVRWMACCSWWLGYLSTKHYARTLPVPWRACCKLKGPGGGDWVSKYQVDGRYAKSEAAADPPPQANHGQIFLSYGRSSITTPFARWCKGQLEAENWTVWMDEVRA